MDKIHGHKNEYVLRLRVCQQLIFIEWLGVTFGITWVPFPLSISDPRRAKTVSEPPRGPSGRRRVGLKGGERWHRRVNYMNGLLKVAREELKSAVIKNCRFSHRKSSRKLSYKLAILWKLRKAKVENASSPFVAPVRKLRRRSSPSPSYSIIIQITYSKVYNQF